MIAELLRDNKSLRMPDLSINDIGLNGAKALAAALQHNTSSQQLCLRDNIVRDNHAKAFRRLLQDNPRLRADEMQFDNVC